MNDPRSRCCAVLLLALLVAPSPTRAEGTAQLGANQDLVETTEIKVDVLTAGEVINISVGNDSTTDATPVEVKVTAPNGQPLPGSPFSIKPGSPGWLGTPGQLPPATITNPLQIVTTVAGTYTVAFDNKRTDLGQGYEQIVDPFDITVTPNKTTPVQPAAPPGGTGRVHSTRWRINAHKFTQDAASNASFYVLTPTGATTDHTWLLEFNGLAGFYFDVAGNGVGMPAPSSGFSIEEYVTPTGTTCPQGYIYASGTNPTCIATPPVAEFEIYLNIPKAAKGGGAAPKITNFAFAGPTSMCTCAVKSLLSTFTFTSDRVGSYQLVLDINKDGKYDPAAGDVLLAGPSVVGSNTVKWDGLDNSGKAVPVGSYNARLSVRTGEFHFVGRDIETANPGLRIYSVDPPLPTTAPASTKMYWNDTKINDKSLKIAPASTVADGLASGSPTAPAVCSKPGATSANAHCWGNFTADPTLSPGDLRYIDTWVFFQESVNFTLACVVDGTSDADNDGLTLAEECGTAGTDPNEGDSDGDGLGDGVEVNGDNKTDPLKGDTDADGIPDGVEDKDKDGKLDTDETDPNNKDSDNDGLDDGVEDADKDGKLDPGETDPTKGDTDGDGLLDGVEDFNRNGQVDGDETDPLKPDTDGDGLSDGVEDTNKDGQRSPGETDPTKKDTDGDGLEDAVEDANKNGLKDANETDPTKADTDGDGLEDGDEDANRNGETDSGETDPLKPDTDGDGLTDGIEKGVDSTGTKISGASFTDPLNRDTDGDGLEDAEEDIDKDGKRDLTETDPSRADTDGDGLSDGTESGVKDNGDPITQANPTDPLKKDTDADGLDDGVEDANKNGVYDENTAKPEDGETDPNNKDTDNDDLPDGWIDKNGDGVYDPGEGEDRNLNGKVDGNETDPRLADTDGGSEPDGSEVLKTGHDPRDPSDDRPPSVGLFGGGGCTMGGEPAAVFAVGLLVLALPAALWLLFGRRRRRRRAVQRSINLFALTLLSWPAQVRAADPVQFSVLNFQPAASTLNFIVTEGGLTLPHLYPSAALYMNYAHRPLELVNTESDARLAEVIKYQLNMDLMLAMGFFGRLELGVALPVTLSQGSEDLAVLDRDPGSTLSGGLGDIRIQPKLRIMTRGPATLALATPFSVPSGKREAFLGDDGVTFSPRAIVGFDTEHVDVAFNVGYRLRKDQSRDISDSQRLTVDDEVFGSAGVRIAVWKDRVDLLADGFVSAAISEQDKEEVPVEALGGVRVYFPYGIIGNVGAGAGVTHGAGAPEFRIFWGVAYQYTADRDPDGDGILNPEDRCPDTPEDKDGFEDLDGCPDNDNDNDGIPDARDRCPDKPEDRDDFEDADGCPDSDNDNDGILDRDDSCPNEAEDKDGVEDADGCPDNDNDNDGIPDDKDNCPADPEDKDNFKDADGCPDNDNDNDKILDAQDKCPNDPEDKDGFEDADGCPDNDNDKDGIPDSKDQCPNEPEVFNKIKDDDGCPDKAKGPVKIQRNKITAPPVFFATAKDRILPRSYPVLSLVAQTLLDNKWVKKVRIEGHTDSRGKDDFNMDLSRRRAASVRTFLIQKGVDAGRLESVGYGETKPIASNRTRAGRAKNRRVEFIIIDPPQSQTTVQP
jgi:outer membrane protein OmpA-like peptidoglycan-associated protein